MYRRFETEIAGRPFVVEIGKYAYLAGGAAMVSYGDTVVLSTATASEKPREGIDFLRELKALFFQKQLRNLLRCFAAP